MRLEGVEESKRSVANIAFERLFSTLTAVLSCLQHIPVLRYRVLYGFFELASMLEPVLEQLRRQQQLLTRRTPTRLGAILILVDPKPTNHAETLAARMTKELLWIDVEHHVVVGTFIATLLVATKVGDPIELVLISLMLLQLNLLVALQLAHVARKCVKDTSFLVQNQVRIRPQHLYFLLFAVIHVFQCCTRRPKHQLLLILLRHPAALDTAML